MKFTFKLGGKIKEAWGLYNQNFFNMILLALVSFVINLLVSGAREFNILPTIIAIILSIYLSLVISYVWIKGVLDILKGKGFNPFSKETLPNISSLWDYIKTGLLVGLCTLGGFILLIIPGIYISLRLMPAIYLSVEKKQGARNSIKEAWGLTKNKVGSIFVNSLLIGLFVFAGYLVFFVGVIITYQMGMILYAMLYKAVSNFKDDAPSNTAEEPIQPEIVQKEEVVPSTEEIK